MVRLFIVSMLAGATLSAARQGGVSLFAGAAGPQGQPGAPGARGAEGAQDPRAFTGDGRVVVVGKAITLATALELDGTQGVRAGSGLLDMRAALTEVTTLIKVANDGTSYCADSGTCASGTGHAFAACPANAQPISGGCQVATLGHVISLMCLSDGSSCQGDYDTPPAVTTGLGWGCRAINVSNGALVDVVARARCVRNP